MIGLVTLSLLNSNKCDKCPHQNGCTPDIRIQRQIEAFKSARLSGAALVEICIPDYK